MFKTFLTALTLQIKQYNLYVWDPFYIKVYKGVLIYSSLGLGLVPLWNVNGGEKNSTWSCVSVRPTGRTQFVFFNLVVCNIV